MTSSYRITKYCPAARAKGTLAQEWTSFSDIGTNVSREEYEQTEQHYIGTVLRLAECMGVSEFFITNLEDYRSSSTYHEGQKIPMNEMSALVTHILREELWCKITSGQCEFHFGYDYHMYFVAHAPLGNCLSHVAKELYVETFVSPYIEFL